jgi:hypothetical protein
MNKDNNLLFLKNYKIIEKIEDFFFINFILKKNLLKKKKLLKNFILNFNFLIKKINLNFNCKNNINFLLHKYYNINLDIFKDKKKINYINIYYLKIIIQKILLENNLSTNKQFYIELLQFINYNLSVLVYLNKLLNIRWVFEDAAKFLSKEVQRGNQFQGIQMDPPAWGIGASGEKWKLEDSINEIMKDVAQLADPDNFFLILNTYSLGFSSLIVENLIKSSFKRTDNLTIGELYLQASKGAKLPLGVFGKIQYIK